LSPLCARRLFCTGSGFVVGSLSFVITGWCSGEDPVSAQK
jgi:hypothetical protein